jgi:hypothetical protein
MGALALALAGCGGGGSPAAAPGYTLSVTALGMTTAGKTASATVSLTPQNGYTGAVSLSCNVSGGGVPAPTCALSESSVPVGTAGASSTLWLRSCRQVQRPRWPIRLNDHYVSIDLPELRIRLA